MSPLDQCYMTWPELAGYSELMCPAPCKKEQSVELLLQWL